MKKNLTIKEVAKLAGVSVPVASRALSNKQRPVSKEKKERVLKAAEQLGYRANPFAQSLSSQETNLIGVVVNHISDLSDLELFDNLIKRFQEVDKQIIIIRIKSADEKKYLFEHAFNHHVDAALILSDHVSPAEARHCFKTNKIIMLNGRHDDQSCSISPDDSIGILQAVGIAQKRHVKNALIISGRKTNKLELKRVDLLIQHLSIHKILSRTLDAQDYSYEAGQKVAQSTLMENDYPDAIFCTSDTLAMATYDVLRQNPKVRIGKDILIFGFDNTNLADTLGYFIPSIAYDRQSYIDKIIELTMYDLPTEELQKNYLIPTEFYQKQTN